MSSALSSPALNRPVRTLTTRRSRRRQRRLSWEGRCPSLPPSYQQCALKICDPTFMYWGYILEGLSGTLQRRGGCLLTWTQRYMAYKEMGLSLYRKTEATGSQDVLPKAVTGSSASGCVCVINNRSTYCLPPTPLTRCWLECRKQVTAACRRAFRASNTTVPQSKGDQFWAKRGHKKGDLDDIKREPKMHKAGNPLLVAGLSGPTTLADFSSASFLWNL